MNRSTSVPGFLLAVLLSLAALILLLQPPVAETQQNSQGLQVRIDNFTFNPGAVTVPVNSVVTWVNKDDTPHVIASNDGLFKSKALDTDETYSFSFTKPGTYDYYCAIHPKMVGKIVVQ